MKVKGGCWRERLWEESFQLGAAVWFVEVVTVLGKQQAGEKKMGGTAVRKNVGSEMVGVLGSLVLGEENPRTPGIKIQNQSGKAPPTGFFEWEKELVFFFLGFLCFFLNLSKLPSP